MRGKAGGWIRGKPVDGEWFAEIGKYGAEVQMKRA